MHRTLEERESRGLALEMIKVDYSLTLAARFRVLLNTAKFNLNGSPNNAIAEALALAVVHAQGSILAERDLVTVSGYGDVVCGTPDGAVVLSCGGLAATQVVRAMAPKRRGGLKHLLRTLLIKIYKSTVWLAHQGEGRCFGSTVSCFVIACWVPRSLSRKALISLQSMLRKAGAGDIDSRFEIVLLVPPHGNLPDFVLSLLGEEYKTVQCAHRAVESSGIRCESTFLGSRTSWRAAIFPEKFGSHQNEITLKEDCEGLDNLLRSIHAYGPYTANFELTGISSTPDDLGFLGILLDNEY